MAKPERIRAKVWDPEGSLLVRRARNALATLTLLGCAAYSGVHFFSAIPGWLAVLACAGLLDLSLSRRFAPRTLALEGEFLRMRAGPLPLRSFHLRELRCVQQSERTLAITALHPGAFSLIVECASAAEATRLAQGIRAANPAAVSETFLRVPLEVPRFAASDLARYMLVPIALFFMANPSGWFTDVLRGFLPLPTLMMLLGLVVATFWAKFGLPERGSRKRLEFDGHKIHLVSRSLAAPARLDPQAHPHILGAGYYSEIRSSPEVSIADPTIESDAATPGGLLIRAGTESRPGATEQALLPSTELATLVASLVQAAPSGAAPDALPPRGDVALSDWFRALDGVPVASGAYRAAAPDRQRLVEMVESPRSEDAARAGAARLLARVDRTALEQTMLRLAPDLSERIRVAIDHADPSAAADAFEALESEQLAKSRRFGP